MQQMAKKRDLAIRESRLHAQTTADLREHIRYAIKHITEIFREDIIRILSAFKQLLNHMASCLRKS
jgi:hypothetical protein